MLLTGCGSLTGLDAASSFSCPMTPGTACRSLSDTYEDAVHGRAPDQIAKIQAEEAVRASAEAGAAAEPADSEGDAAANTPAASASEDERRPAKAAAPASSSRPRSAQNPAPERLPEVIVTIWMAPWTDDEGDFHEGERIHARAFDSRWAAARRRADNSQGRRAVVQLPFSRRAPIAAAEPPRTAAGAPDAGEGAARLSEARHRAFAGAAR